MLFRSRFSSSVTLQGWPIKQLRRQSRLASRLNSHAVVWDYENWPTGPMRPRPHIRPSMLDLG